MSKGHQDETLVFKQLIEGLTHWGVRIGLIVTGVMVMFISVDFSVAGFNFATGDDHLMYVARVLAWTGVLCELAFNQHGRQANPSIVFLGLWFYVYGISTNILGIWVGQGMPVPWLTGDPADWMRIAVAVSFGVIAEVLPESVIMYGLLGPNTNRGDFVSSIIGGMTGLVADMRRAARGGQQQRPQSGRQNHPQGQEQRHDGGQRPQDPRQHQPVAKRPEPPNNGIVYISTGDSGRYMLFYNGKMWERPGRDAVGNWGSTKTFDNQHVMGEWCNPQRNWRDILKVASGIALLCTDHDLVVRSTGERLSFDGQKQQWEYINGSGAAEAMDDRMALYLICTISGWEAVEEEDEEVAEETN